jgi:thioredoxin-like negative regulator of GroEL
MLAEGKPMKHTRVLIIFITITVSILTGYQISHAAQNAPESAPQPFTARYQVIDDLVTMQARIDALEAELHAMRTEAGWQRSEDLKRLYRLELALYGLDGWGCIP